MILNIFIIAALMILAIGLVLLEIFLLPGITIAGVGGGLFAIGGIVYAYMQSPTMGAVTLVTSAIVFGGVFFWLLRAKSFNRVALKTNVDSTVTSARELSLNVGDEGVAISRLAPIGKARFNGVNVEAKSTGEFINEDTLVVITRIDGYNVVVKPKEAVVSNETVN